MVRKTEGSGRKLVRRNGVDMDEDIMLEMSSEVKMTVDEDSVN